MENITLVLGTIVGLIAIAAAFIAWSKMCEGRRKELNSFNVNLAEPITKHLTKIGKTEYIAAKEDRYELAEIKALNANSEIMEGLEKNLAGIYFSIRELSSWQGWFCCEK